MPAWITFDHRCRDCGETAPVLHDRTEVVDVVPCQLCGTGTADRIISANITQASFVDGNGRWDSIRERRVVEKQMKKAQRLGKRDDVKRLKVELGKAGLTKGHPK